MGPTSFSCIGWHGAERVPGGRAKQLVMLASDTSECQLEFGINLTEPFTLTRQQTTTMQTHRLNVDDVVLTDEGNRKVTGTFNVRRARPTSWSGWILADQTKTPGAVDLPSGHYQVRVTFQSATGPSTTDYEVDL